MPSAEVRQCQCLHCQQDTEYPARVLHQHLNVLLSRLNEQQRRQHPIEVNVHDFPGDALGRAVPYGIYDLQHNEGAVYVGMSADTPEFAVTANGQWWEHRGRVVDPRGTALLILADGGGSHGRRSRVWKAQLQSQLSDRLDLRVTVCHDPTGGSQWNPIKHRLCSQISRNWAGQPLRTVETMLGYLRNTTTTKGLRVTARPLRYQGSMPSFPPCHLRLIIPIKE